MNAKELSDLNLWIAERVMNYEIVDDNGYKFLHDKNDVCVGVWCDFNPTTDSIQDLEVLKRCLEKLKSQNSMLEMMQWSDGKITVMSGNERQASDLSLEIAIAKFSKTLFTK